MIKVGSDFSGVGSFDLALLRLKIKHETIFACDQDKFARQTYLLNYKEPNKFPANVYDRRIPDESLDIYMSSPPCQSFSQVGQKLGKKDKRGILFFNSYEFIKKNKPRYFIFENVKGLLSDDKGKTFQEWLNYLGGKSVNGLPVIFPDENSVPYHIYHAVINSKDHNVPQNRPRVFIVGIRDDQDNFFQFPKKEPLTKKLRDVLEYEIDSKYFLSDELINYFLKHKDKHDKQGNGFSWGVKTQNEIANCLRANGSLAPTDNTIFDYSRTNISKYVLSDKRTNTLKTRRAVITNRNNKDYAQCIISGYYKMPSDSEYIIIDSEFSEYQNKVRRLTPRECFRLMDFPETFKFECSDTQAWKQAGNSIVVKCLEKIIEKFNLK
jgi:DNA (cytosine-5)-methyltransferase 1